MSNTRFYSIVGILLLTGYCWLTWNVLADGADSFHPTVCLFKEATGLPCPSCGTTRALLLLTHGKFSESYLLNPFGFFLAAGLMILPFWLTFDLVAKRTSFRHWYVQTERFFSGSRWMIASSVAIVIANWIWNISKGL